MQAVHQIILVVSVGEIQFFCVIQVDGIYLGIFVCNGADLVRIVFQFISFVVGTGLIVPLQRCQRDNLTRRIIVFQSAEQQVQGTGESSSSSPMGTFSE